MALMLITLFTVVSCNSVKFSRGTIDGDVYTSEFAGITFKKPSEWEFYTDEEISILLGLTSEQLGSEEFDKTTEGSIIDFMAYSSDNNSVNIEFKKGGAFTNINASIKESVRLIKESYESIGWTCTASDAVDVKLGNNTYKAVTVQINAEAINMTQYCYFRKDGNYLIAITCTATKYITQSQFEAMFS